MNLPPIAKKEHLTCHWFYRNTNKDAIALVTRHDKLSSGESKKWFNQYQLESNGNWVEGAVTPSPLFGIDTLPKSHFDQKIYIFEGEKCTQAAHHLDLPAITSMRGANQSHLADWAILAQYRHLKDFILIPDNDVAGRQYIENVYKEIQKACPHANIWVCKLPSNEKGADLVDWIQISSNTMSKWDGFGPIDNPYSQNLKQALERYVEENCVKAEKFFSDLHEREPCFESDPESIQELLSAVLSCPIDTLPVEVVSWISNLADQMQIEPDYIAAALIVQIGSLIGRKRALKLRKGTNWIEFPNMWGMLIGRPSTLKSVAMQETIKPLNALARAATAEYKKTVKQFQKELGTWEIQKKIAAEKYKDVCKESNTTTAATYSISDPPDKPKHRRYKSDDPTVEKLGILLYENPQGLLLYRDELAGWLYNLQKKGKENDRQFYLESWNAKQSFDVDRISRDSLHIDALCLSILGGIQPGPLSQYIHSAIKGGIGDDGFIQRFQIMVWPDGKPEWNLVENTNLQAWEPYIQQIFQQLDQLQFSNGQPVTLEFNQEAQALFDDWQKRHETRLRKGSLSPHIEAHLAKYKKLLPALCLIFEHMKAALTSQFPADITKECLEKALIWLEYFESHANRVYGSSSNAIHKTATDLIRRIQRGEVKVPFTLRDVYYGRHWSGLSNPIEVEEVLEYLVDKNYLKSLTQKTSGRESKKYWVHPKVLE